MAQSPRSSFTDSPSSFVPVFVAVTLGAALIVGAFLLHGARPHGDLDERGGEFVEAVGDCAACHRRETPGVVHLYEGSPHARAGVTCLECHRPTEGQQAWEHRGFTLTEDMTGGNCAQCHAEEYAEFLRSRHAAPAWAAVHGARDFTPEQIAHAESFHPGTIERPANSLALLEGSAAQEVGCQGCHDIGAPNSDGTIGTCIECHSAHGASLALARQPTACGQCHLGPDHSQIEIWSESKHGTRYVALLDQMNLDVPADELTVRDMPAPTCATCHMSGLEGAGVTHDTTERLSWFLYAAVTEERPNAAAGRAAMQEICGACHASSRVAAFYEAGEGVVHASNEYVRAGQEIIAGLRARGLLTPEPFDEPIEYVEFDLWHYYGRTAKHGAFMGGPDYVQWHGFYELNLKLTELRAMAQELEEAAARHAEGSGGAAGTPHVVPH